VSCAIGNYQIAKWTRANKDKTLMDKVTASDIVYSIIEFESKKEVWEEEILIKASDKTDEEKQSLFGSGNHCTMRDMENG
jgi:hypothetical protein